jgi:hypothetical protein
MALTQPRPRSGAASCILRALVTPVLAKLAIMKPTQQVRVVIKPVGGTQHLVIVMAVIARRGFLFRPLADDAQLFPAQLDDLGQYLLQIHRSPFSALAPAMPAVKQTTGIAGSHAPRAPTR